MWRQRTNKVTREEKFALAGALFMFALLIITIANLDIGSYLEVREPEITIVVSSNALTPYVISGSQSIHRGNGEASEIGSPRKKKPAEGIPVPVSYQVHDTIEAHVTTGRISTGTDSAIKSGTRYPLSAIDSLIIVYPGYRQFALREEMKKTRPKTRNDSLLKWSKENFAEQMSRHGKIDPATLNQLMMLEQSKNFGPYHIVTPGIGVGIPFDYTTILKKIISIFEKPPED
jgi:hypothetical protein